MTRIRWWSLVVLWAVSRCATSGIAEAQQLLETPKILSTSALSLLMPPRLIVRGDDMGFSHAGNEALILCFKEGIETSIEVLVPSPWFPEAVRMLIAAGADVNAKTKRNGTSLMLASMYGTEESVKMSRWGWGKYYSIGNPAASVTRSKEAR